MNVLLTGAAGFIGQHVAAHFLELGWDVTTIDRLDEAGNLGALAPLKERFGARLTHVWWDLRAAINPVMLRDSGSFDYVVHLAAASHVDRSVRDPISFIADNVTGTANVLEYVRHNHPGAKLLYFSTDEVFGPADNGGGFDELSAHNPNNPYAASKSAAEQLCPAWANTYGMRIVVTHCTNVYGPGQYREKFIPLCYDRLVGGKVIQIHARDGVCSSRYYLHVKDVARAVETVLTKGGVIGSRDTGRYNISGSSEHSNLDVCLMIARELGVEAKAELVEYVADRPRHDQRYEIGGTRLLDLGWSPLISLPVGIRNYVACRRSATT